MWSETSNSIKPDLAADAPAVSNLAVDHDASRVVKGNSAIWVWSGWIRRYPPFPDPAESL
jgi:hypothetical protein